MQGGQYWQGCESDNTVFEFLISKLRISSDKALTAEGPRTNKVLIRIY